jgi:hypothetical protein
VTSPWLSRLFGDITTVFPHEWTISATSPSRGLYIVPQCTQFGEVFAGTLLGGFALIVRSRGGSETVHHARLPHAILSHALLYFTSQPPHSLRRQYPLYSISTLRQVDDVEFRPQTSIASGSTQYRPSDVTTRRAVDCWVLEKAVGTSNGQGSVR